MSDIDEINDSLDQLSDVTFENISEAWSAIVLKLESYGIEAPKIDSFEDEMAFKLLLDDEEQSQYLYVNFDTEDEKCIVYATFLNPEESEILDNLGTDIETHKRTRKVSDRE